MSRNIIVTGGFGVLGRAVSAALAEKGATVIVIDLAPVPDGWSGPAVGNVDLADEGQVVGAFAQITEEFGAIDGLVNIAGGFVWETMAGGSQESWDRMYAMNLKTAAITCRAAIPHLGKGAAIVNIGAAAARNAGEGMAPYAASKAGVLALTQGLSAELKGKGVRVNAVLPTIIDTPTNRTDMPDADFEDWIKPASAACVIAFLLSGDACNITGEGIALSMGG